MRVKQIEKTLQYFADKVAQPKRKVSICPDYKQAAILDAFQHYGII